MNKQTNEKNLSAIMSAIDQILLNGVTSNKRKELLEMCIPGAVIKIDEATIKIGNNHFLCDGIEIIKRSSGPLTVIPHIQVDFPSDWRGFVLSTELSPVAERNHDEDAEKFPFLITGRGPEWAFETESGRNSYLEGLIKSKNMVYPNRNNEPK